MFARHPGIVRRFSSTVNRYPQSIDWEHVRGIVGGLSNTVISNEPIVRSLQLALFEVLHLTVPRDTLFQDFCSKQKLVERVLQLPSTQSHLGRFPTDHDVSNVLTKFEAHLIDHYRQFHVGYLPNTAHALRTFHRRGIEFGCTTDLSHRIIKHLEKKLPLWPIVHRMPRPAGIYRVLDRWNSQRGGSAFREPIQLHQIVKVGDSLSDLEEARAAKIPFVAVVGHVGTALGLSSARVRDLENEFRLSGAVNVVRDLDELAGWL